MFCPRWFSWILPFAHTQPLVWDLYSCLRSFVRSFQAATLEDIETVLDGHPDKLVVIDFTSKNCPPCKKVAPLYEELSESEEFSEMVKFLKVDVDENPDAVAKYQVTGWPTFIFIKQGQVQTEIVGGKLAEATLYDWVKMLMPKDRVEQEWTTNKMTHWIRCVIVADFNWLTMKSININVTIVAFLSYDWRRIKFSTCFVDWKSENVGDSVCRACNRTAWCSATDISFWTIHLPWVRFYDDQLHLRGQGPVSECCPDASSLPNLGSTQTLIVSSCAPGHYRHRRGGRRSHVVRSCR